MGGLKNLLGNVYLRSTLPQGTPVLHCHRNRGSRSDSIIIGGFSALLAGLSAGLPD
jgi:hypothetical protein